jgi:membrane protein involved in colicin uptake
MDEITIEDQAADDAAVARIDALSEGSQEPELVVVETVTKPKAARKPRASEQAMAAAAKDREKAAKAKAAEKAKAAKEAAKAKAAAAKAKAAEKAAAAKAAAKAKAEASKSVVKISWFATLDGERKPRTGAERGEVRWDAKCSCGWKSGKPATFAPVRKAVNAHKLEAHGIASQSRAAAE